MAIAIGVREEVLSISRRIWSENHCWRFEERWMMSSAGSTVKARGKVRMSWLEEVRMGVRRWKSFGSVGSVK
ncbi:MAG: hypothetical protein AAGC74_09655 [Verrucomicrobiota bacterium]